MITKDEGRQTLKLLRNSLPLQGDVAPNEVATFHTILNQLEESGFHMDPFYVPRRYTASAVDVDIVRAHVVAAIHHLKKARLPDARFPSHQE
jgi:hypothetical protein